MARGDTEPIDQRKAMSAILALLVAEREERCATEAGDARKTETILASAGLSANEIAPLVGKNYDAVAKTIQRARQSPTGKSKKKA